MQEQSSILDGRRVVFDSLCREYEEKWGMRIDGDKKEALFGMFLLGESGLVTINPNQPVFEMAKMLKQLSFSKGAFSLVVGGVTKDYDNPTLVEVLKQSLVEALESMVKKNRQTMVNPALWNKDMPDMEVDLGESMEVTIQLTSGVEIGTKVYLYPEGEHPSQDSFSMEELNAIIDYGKILAERVKGMQGNVKNQSTPTRNPGLGKIALAILDLLPEDTKPATQNAFIADFLHLAGFLNFKGEIWLEGFSEKQKEEKDRQVRRWIEQYNKTKRE